MTTDEIVDELTDELIEGLYKACFSAKEEYLLKLANENNVSAQLALAELYFYNDSFDCAYTWFQKATENGSADALYYIGVYHHDSSGFGVVENSNEKALDYISKAVDAGSAKAMYYLGYYGYICGAFCKPDERKGIELITKAAKHRNTEARHRLSLCYRFGFSGVEKDLKTALDYETRTYYLLRNRLCRLYPI